MGDQYLEQRIHEILRGKIAMGAGVSAGWAKGQELSPYQKKVVNNRKKINARRVAKGEEKIKYKKKIPKVDPRKKVKKEGPKKNVKRVARTHEALSKNYKNGMPKKAIEGLERYNAFVEAYKKKHGSSKGVKAAWHAHKGTKPRVAKKKADKKVVKAAGLLLQNMMGSGLLNYY